MKHSLIISLVFSASAVFGQDFLAAPAAAQRPHIPTFSTSVDAASRRAASTSMKSWKWSLVPLFASHAMDAGSSWGHVERNSLLAGPDGRFGAKAAGIKFGAVGAAVIAEYFLMKRHPKLAKMIVQANYGNAALTSGLAVHNLVALH
jgi:hypothetical protein